MFERFFRQQDCPACKVYQDWIKAKENELEDTKDLLAAERAERQLLEERLLRFIRVIPLENTTQPVVGPERISRRLDFATIRAEQEKKLADATPEGKDRRMYWQRKAEKVEPEVVGKQEPEPTQVNEDSLKNA